MRQVMSVIALLLAAACCRADGAPPPSNGQDPADGAAAQQTDATKKTAEQDTKAAETPEAKAAEEKLPPITPLLLDVGWANWSLSGNRQKFGQYATPVRGLFLGNLRYDKTSFADGVQGFASFRGNEDDHFLGGRLDAYSGALRLDGYYQHNRFYDPTPVLVDPSDRRIHEITARGLVTPSIGVGLIYRMDEQNRGYAAPWEPIHQRTRFTSLSVQGNVGHGRLGLDFADWQFFDRTLVVPDSSVRTLSANALLPVAPALTLDGQYAYHWIEQSGLAASHADALRVSGSLDIGPSSDLTMGIQRYTSHQPNVQSALVREQWIANTSLLHRWPNWTVRLDAQYREAERINGDHDYLSIPKWWTLGGRLNGRLTKQIRLSVRGSSERMSQRPLATTDDTRGLSWSARDMAQVKLDGAFRDLTGYLVYTYRNFENVDRRTKLSTDYLTTGANWQVSPRVSLFAQWDYEWWRGRSEIADFPTFETFLPDSRVAALGVSWAIGNTTSFLASLTDFVTNNDNPLALQDGNIHGQFITMSVQHRFPAGYEVGLTVAPWTYRDRVVGTMNYTSTLVGLTAKGKF